jgi:uncharacterized membrane protein YbhN (UPF0104 family)
VSDGGVTAVESATAGTIARLRRWAAVAVAVAALLYVGYAAFVGFKSTAAELAGFRWSLYAPVLALTAVNYGLRYAKWTWLLRRLEVKVPPEANLWVFLAGLAMVISPGKAGELLKPYLVRELTGTPMERTVPALIAERGTDGIAVVALAALGVSTYASDKVWLIAATAAVIVVGLGVIAIEPLSLALIAGFAKLPVVGRVAPRLEASYRALQLCLTPGSLFALMGVSLAAWWAECVGYWLVFRGLGVTTAGIDHTTFLYAFATVFGGASPGGIGMADGALTEGAVAIVPGLDRGQALAAALLIRLATLWFGVVIGAIALVRMEAVLEKHRVR